MVWLPWVLVPAAFVLGLLVGAVATHVWLLRAARGAPAVEAVPVAPDPTPETGPQEAVGAMPEPQPAEEPEWREPPVYANGYAAEDDVPTLEPASDLQAALQAHQEVLEKLEAKYRNASAPVDDDVPRKRRKAEPT